MGTPAKRPSNAAGASPIPRRLQAAVSTVSTAQILRASGYSAAEAAALRALSDIAGRYIESLGRAAAAFAEVHGRTEPNVADIVLALEDHALGGFPGAFDPARPEVPFAKPLPRRDPGSGTGKGWESFAAAEREPLRHVPQWLPRFPEGWEERLHGRSGEAEAKDEEDTGEVNGRRTVPENREKVSFCLREKSNCWEILFSSICNEILPRMFYGWSY
ncbi:hypothetical protein PVAP13_3NG178718 [Panicum virgatum]|uniref:Bromodomain associated domain-containing protein n=1 Tax=Panicum virgatum TaxID=38727 RepID=A0A8T0U7Z0_PANVG|nr:hypothetical protein PVAP13_3NG178718 [Panicum virgatum]